MNIQLGRGKVHHSTTPAEFMPGPACGGNRAVEGYRKVTAAVDCKNCLKILAAEAEAPAVEAAPEAAPVEVPADVKAEAFERGRALGMDHAEAADYAAEAAKNAAAEAPAVDDQTDAIDNGLTNMMHGLWGAEDALQQRIDARGGTWDFPALFDLDGKMVPARQHWGEFGESWRILDENGRGAEWFNPSKAKKPETRRAKNAEKGFYLGEVSVPAKAELRGGNLFALNACAIPLDENYSTDTTVTVVDNGMGENMSEATYTTTHPTTGEAVTFAHKGTDAPRWATWNDQGEGFTRVGVSRAATEAAALKAIKRDGRNSVTPVIPGNSPEVIAESAIIAPNAGETAPAPIEKGNEMPPRKRAAAKAETAPVEATAPEAPAEAAPEAPKNDHADAIQRVKDLTAQVLAIAEAGDDADVDRAKELAEQAETVIGELPTEYRTALRTALGAAKRGEALTEGGAPAKKTAAVAKKTTAAAATKETQDYKKAIPDAEKVVADIASAFAKGVDAEKENSNSARTIAEKVLAARLFLKDKDGHPDIHGKSHAAKTIAGDFYTAAGAGFERTEDNEDALDRLVKSVNNLRNDVLVKYVRTITPEDAAKFFPLALKADPKAEPAAAIQKFYSIPAQSTFEIQAEKRRLERAARKALGAGDEKKAKELTEAIKTVGKSEGEGEGEGAAPTTPADKRKAKHTGAVESATETLGTIEADLDKIDAAEAAELVAILEAFSGKTATLTAMLKAKIG
jgi:hypothetical protein